jgi:DNA-directed RNA polymerase subunit RPC12/RpoP
MSDDELLELASRVLRLNMDRESKLKRHVACPYCGAILMRCPEPVRVLH